jgi:hypothetical protein
MYKVIVETGKNNKYHYGNKIVLKGISLRTAKTFKQLDVDNIRAREHRKMKPLKWVREAKEHIGYIDGIMYAVLKR